MKIRRVGNTITVNGVLIYTYDINKYPINFIEDKISSMYEFGLSFMELGILMGDEPINKN